MEYQQMVPPYLNKYVHFKISRWVESAFQARMMQENDHFILDVDKTSNQKSGHKKKIIVVDKDTGVEQYSTRWSNGLAQFLELKYKRSISVESLKAVFMSNKAFFQRYSASNNTSLFGLTGTLGSENSMSFLADLYGVRFVDVVTSRDKNFHMLPGVVSFDMADWLDSIAKVTVEQAVTRPVLIISENLEMTKYIEAEMLRHGVSPCSIIKYGRDGDSVEERFRKRPATGGDIILATNKGGRGTDIHVDPAVNESSGGLHVVLTFLPENVRVEEQAFAPGTGQFIIRVDQTEYEATYDLAQHTPSGVRTRLQVLGDAIIEREKINRDNKETARLCELKQKNIVHLQLEEDLFEAFSTFKRDEASKLIQTIVGKYPINLKLQVKLKIKYAKNDFGKETHDAFDKCLKNKWAFWLDKAAEQIKQVNKKVDQQTLIDDFKSKFITKQKNILSNCATFENLVDTLTEMPEEAIHIGKVCLKYEQWILAKYCFDRSKVLGDITGFGNIGSIFCSLKVGDQSKKEIRRQLKIAVVKLEALKQSIMSNFKMADFLSQYASDKQNQNIAATENLYQEQVRGKLEVIGLQLNYLKRPTGTTLDPSDFVQEKQESVGKSDMAKAEHLYGLLIEAGIIQKEKLTKSCRLEYAQIIRDSLDPSVSESLIDLLSKVKEYELKDIEKLVCYSSELWDAFEFPAESVTECFTIDLNKIKAELKDDQMAVWNTIEDKITSPLDVDVSIFVTSKPLQDLKDHLVASKFLNKTRRVKVDHVNIKNLKLTGKYSKYAKLEYKQAESKKGIIEFLSEMKEHIVKEGSKYLYEMNLPFGTRDEEAKKLWIFLKEKRIIKSGGLKCHKYGNTKEELTNSIAKVMESNPQYENDKDVIMAKLISIQGTVRASEKPLEATLKDFMDLEDQEVYMTELDFFEGVGLNKFIVFNEVKSWWDWRAFAVALLGLVQVIGGAILCCYGFVNIGQMLICEGVNDMVYATMAGLSGTFSWRDWAIQKAISVTLSLLTLGVGKLASLGQTVTKVGSLSRSAIFLKCIGQSCLTFATTCLTNIITEKIMVQLSEGLVKKIVDFIETNLLKGVNETIQKRVETLYATSLKDEDFEKRFSKMKKNFDKAVGNDVVVNNNIKSICSKVSSTLSNNMQSYGSLLTKTSDSRVKAVGHVINGVLIVDKIWKIINSGIQTYNLISAVLQLIDTKFEEADMTENNTNRRELKVGLLNTRVEQIKQILRVKIMSKVAEQVSAIVRAIVGLIVNKLASMAANATSALIKSCTKGKNPLEQSKSSKTQTLQDQPGNNRRNKTETDEREDEARRKGIQDNIKNPKDALSDSNRPLGLVDVRMLANQKMRNIEITDKDTGQKILVRPEGFWRRMPASFKETASINFERNAETGIGHFYTAQGSETFKQVNGRNDCLFIAFNESLGRKVNEDLIRLERANFANYTMNHIDDYQKYVSEVMSNN